MPVTQIHLTPPPHTHTPHSSLFPDEKKTQSAKATQHFFFSPMAAKTSPDAGASTIKCCRCEMCDGMFLWTCNRCGKTYCGVWGANHASDPVAHPCVALCANSAAPLRFTNVSNPTDPLATITLTRLVERWQSCISPSSVDEAAKIFEDCAGCSPAVRAAILAHLTKKQPALLDRIVRPWTQLITVGTATVTTETGADGGKAVVSRPVVAADATDATIVLTGMPDLASISGCCFHVHATLATASPRDGQFQVHTVDDDGTPTKGDVGWVAVHRDGTRSRHSVLTSGRFDIEASASSRIVTVQFARPFARPPVVLLSTAGGSSARTSAMIVGTPTTQSFACCVNDAGTGQQSGGSVNWVAIDRPIRAPGDLRRSRPVWDRAHRDGQGLRGHAAAPSPAGRSARCHTDWRGDGPSSTCRRRAPDETHGKAVCVPACRHPVGSCRRRDALGCIHSTCCMGLGVRNALWSPRDNVTARKGEGEDEVCQFHHHASHTH